MPSAKKLQKQAWKSYGAWSSKAAEERTTGLAYTRAKMAASGFKITPASLKAASEKVEMKYEEDMSVYQDTEAYDILKKDYKTAKAGADLFISGQGKEVSGLSQRLQEAQGKLDSYKAGSAKYVSAHEEYQSLKSMYEESEALYKQNQEIYEKYGTLESMFTAKYDDKSDLLFKTFTGGVYDPTIALPFDAAPTNPYAPGYGTYQEREKGGGSERDPDYMGDSRPSRPAPGTSYGEYEAYV